MANTHVDPKLDVVALVDPWDEESGCELSDHGRRIVREKLQAIGYADVVFISPDVAGGYVAASNGKWLKPDSRPVEGWRYYDAPSAEVLVEAGIDFGDDAMWA